MPLQEKLLALYSARSGLIRGEINPSYLKLLGKLGNPHKKLPPIVHVAGTNGKGSVIAFMNAILTAAGYRVHVYTSPHLVKFNERIVLAGQVIDDVRLESLLDKIMATADPDAPLSFFEISTAMAFTAFEQTPADIVLLETGLGGRLDCTNVIAAPALTVITSLSYDHTEILGEKMSEIAYEKAGIMKKNAPCLLAPQSYDEAYELLAKHAKEKQAPLFETEKYAVELPSLALTGTHQKENACTALAALRILEKDFIVDDTAIKKGLQNTYWPARLQKIDYAPFHNTKWELWLDGGHNEGAGKILAAQAQQWKKEDGKPLHLMVGMMARKDYQAFLTPLLAHIHSLVALPVPGMSDFIKPEEFFTAINEAHRIPVLNASHFQEALKQIKENYKTEGRILITGSFYLAGHVLSCLAQP